jgi:hypothetical protein
MIWSNTRTRIDPKKPEAIGYCDLTGFRVMRKDLVQQMEYRGTQLVWNGFLVYKDFVDEPNRQSGAIILGPDPIPVLNPRPGSRPEKPTVQDTARVLSGYGFSSSGNAANAFDENNLTACTQTAPNGYIGYNFNGTPNILWTGILSAATLTYTLVIEYSFNSMQWMEYTTIPAQTYPSSEIVWLTGDGYPSGSSWRIREVGGATLNISELYFNMPTKE